MSSNERKWISLDNAAKIFPATKSKLDSKVFRFSCQLKEPIDKDILQLALNETLKIFPIFKSILRRGLFWYYLEKIDIEPKIELESIMPCSNLYEKSNKQLLFRVNYFKKRINLEVFHALSDGEGSLQFLKALIFKYIVIKHKNEFKQIPEYNYDASELQKEADSFKKYYNPHLKNLNKSENTKPKKAYIIKNLKYSHNRFNVIEGIIAVDELLKKAHEYDTTLTIFLISIFIKSIESEMEIRKKIYPIVIAVPINLRSFFDSKTIRNFFGVINVKYKLNDENSLNDIIKKIKLDFKNELNEEKIQKRINTLVDLEKHFLLRAVPLIIKDFILKIGSKLSDAETTSCFSNIGKIKICEEIVKYIDHFDAFISTENLQISACSFENNLTVSISSVFENTDIQKNFFRIITDLGVNVEISTTIPNKDVN